MQIVGDGLLDEVRHAVHDEVAHTGDYLKHCHKLIPLIDKSRKTPPKRQTMLVIFMSLHILPILGLINASL